MFKDKDLPNYMNTYSSNSNMSTISEGKMEKFGCFDAYSKISNKLQGRSIPDSFSQGLESLRNAGNKYQVYKLSINAPKNSDVLRQVIGRNGCYFIRTTQECDLDFIWHNRDNNTIEFWGPRESIQRAYSVIKSRITKYEGLMKMEKDSPLDLTDGTTVPEQLSTSTNMVTEHKTDDNEASKVVGSDSGDQ